MEQWLTSVHSDGTRQFVSNPEPELFETVTIRIRMYEDAPAKHVFLRSVPNGAENLVEMRKENTRQGLTYYAARLKMTEPRMQYQFYLACEDIIYYYNQKEITTYIPDQTYDFVLLTDYRQPHWVKNAVFYQIFPDRFCNGNAKNDVADGEYTLNGHPTSKIKDWNQKPLPYSKGFCLDFYGGDLEGVKEKIGYLKRLGVTAVYLNPIFQAPSVHKYDCIDYFHVDPHFGGDDALADLSAALHEAGMKLILDISINHTGTAHKWFNRDNLYFDSHRGAYQNPESKEREYYFFKENSQDYKGWYENADLPTLNYTSEELRNIIYKAKDSVLRKWLKPPYSIDGWRFDVADVMARNNEVQLAHEVWPQIRSAIREENPEAYILAEDWGDCSDYLQGEEWDSPMNYYGCGRVIRQFLGEPDLFNSRNEILRNIAYKMTAEDAKNRIMEHLAKLPYVIWQNQFNLFDSHDVSRLHNNPKIHPSEYRGAVMFLFTLVGAASIYYGDEAQAAGWIEEVEGCRGTMPWDSNFESTDNFRLYQKLVWLKKEHEAFSQGGMKFLYAEDEILAIARFDEREAYVTIISVNEEDCKIYLPLAAVGASAPEEDCDLFGRKLSYQALDDKGIELQVKAHEAYLIKCSMKK